MKFEHLFSPIKINQTMMKNRIVAAPVNDTFEEKALGGAGLVIAGHAIVEEGYSSFASADEKDAFSKYEVEKTRSKILRIHQAGARASIEVFHAGQYARVHHYAKGVIDYTREDGIKVIAMNEDDMEVTLKSYEDCARNAQSLGFDSIFLHFGHGWLPAQFLSPLFNKRNDKYGGSLENRARFPLAILKRVREAVGNKYLIDMRISAYEWVDGSIDFEDVKQFILWAEEYIDTVQISAGLDINHEGNVHMATTNFEEHMPNVIWAKEVKKVVSIPVSVVGAVLSPKEADELIANGDVDLVAFGRSFIADPDWPKKAQEGREEDIVPCIRCLQCYHIASNRRCVGCSVNPRYTNEEFIAKEIIPSTNRKHVVIVGGGPAGMQAAITCAKRGHAVHLYEKTSRLGGQLYYVAKEQFKEDIARYLKYLLVQIEKYPIDIHLNCTLTPDDVKSMKPDAIFLAIGAKATTPPIKNINYPNVVFATDAIEKENDLGEEIVIIGGGTIGAELALELSLLKHKHVTIVEMGSELAPQGNMLYKIALRQKMEKTKLLNVYLQSSCQLIEKDYVMIIDQRGKQRKIMADHVIVCTGLAPLHDEAHSFYGICPNTVMIGDCDKPRKIMDAVFEGYANAIHV